jgi:hypothetical protein
MDTSGILAAIDKELAVLQAARASIVAVASSTGSPLPLRRGPGRPPKDPLAVTSKPAKKKLSAAGRARIAAAQKARWAAKKSTIATPQPTKSAAKKVNKTSANR